MGKAISPYRLLSIWHLQGDTMTPTHALPTVVIGAGPIGLAAAAELLQRGQDVVVLESGSAPAAA
ncbi:MAG: FAD-dependent oxidoreductase, partial [Ornithinimicrobium sp.]